MIRYKVWVGTDTLLYLPIYALADLGVLARVADTIAPGQEVTIQILRSPSEGDVGAIHHMLEEAERAEADTIHIAIGDPVAAVEVDDNVKSARLLGAFIKKPSFWEVGRALPDGVQEAKHKYIYYNESFETGYFIGRHLSVGSDRGHRTTCSMGEEFRYLQMPERYAGEVRVITADIYALAAAELADSTIIPIRKLMEHKDFQEFVTVGITTHVQHINENRNAVSLFLEAVRSACVLLRTAEKPAAALILQLLKHGRESAPAMAVDAAPNADLEAVSAKIAKHLFEDRVYSDSLCVSFHEWRGAVEARGLQRKLRVHYESVYYKLYDPSLSGILTGTWLLRAFADYGRFVRAVNVLKYGSSFAFASFITSLFVIVTMYYRQEPGRADRLFVVAASSCIFAAIATAWIAYAFLRDRVSAFWRLRRWFWSMTPTVVAIITLALILISLATVSLVAPLGLGAGDLVLAIVTPLAPAVIWTLHQIRHA